MSDPAVPRPHVPYIPATQHLPEITVKTVVLACMLSVVLGAANIYLGLFAGMTVSASIPAAVISMALLRLMGHTNILQNNVVQTAASAGESLAAGVIFTIPALVLMGTWTEFNYWETTAIAGLGGVLGVLFTIPLRRALIVDSPLPFPEGVATAEVLKVGDQGGGGVRYIGWAGLIGALYKLGSTGVKLWPETVQGGRWMGGSIAYVGSNLSPALVAVGYIVGLNVSVLMFAGGAINWWIAIPIVAKIGGAAADTTTSATDAAFGIWSAQTRYLGVGAMIVGGLHALIKLRTHLWTGIRSGLQAYRDVRAQGAPHSILRTEHDAPMNWVVVAGVVSVIPLFLIFRHATGHVPIAAFMALAMLVAGFLFSAVASYMAGLVGSSNNPISGVTIATILTVSLLLVWLGTDSAIGPSAAIFIGAVVCCAAAIGGDNMQDLKAGHLLGATPYKQQIMQTVGVGVAAFAMAPVLTLLQNAYGIGPRTLEHPGSLTAPQASLMASVATGVFEGGLPWGLMTVGLGIAVAVIALDALLEKMNSSFRAPVLAVAVGIYLPFELTVPIFLGGLVAFAGQRFLGNGDHAGTDQRDKAGRHGVLFAAGLITGEALMGISLAVPIALGIALPQPLAHEMAWAGMLLLGGVLAAQYWVGTRTGKEA